MTDIKWQDPPPKTRPKGGSVGGNGRLQLFVAQLKTSPGTWALDVVSSKNNASSVRKSDFPGTEWTGRLRDDGRFDMYGRWIGDA